MMKNMNLNKYVQSIDKSQCKRCKFYTNEELKSRPIIIIPPPNKPQIMLISRDPTIDFLSVYKYADGCGLNEKRRILFAAGIPQSLIVQIRRFLKRENNKKKKLWNKLEQKLENLYNIFEVAYWTHLHKCPTDEKNKLTKKCADKWLENEIEIAKKNKIQILICLGRDVEDWVNKNVGRKIKGIRRIHLPHPSGANNGKWYTQIDKDKKNIKNNIKKLMENVK